MIPSDGSGRCTPKSGSSLNAGIQGTDTLGDTFKGTAGNAINALMSAAAMNFGKLLGGLAVFGTFCERWLTLVSAIFSGGNSLPRAQG